MPKPKKTESAKLAKPAPKKTATKPTAKPKKSPAAKKLTEAKAALIAVKDAVVEAIPSPKPKTKATKTPAASKRVAKVTKPVETTKKPVAKTKKTKSPGAPVTNEDIGLRAYYIGEHRQQHGLEGDTATDWIEAERQLKTEAGL